MTEKRQERSVRTRERLLQAAATVIQRDGAQNLTLQRVATEAEISKGGLLHHFATKEQLLEALLDRTMVDADEGLASLVDGDAAGAFARAYLEYVRVPARQPLDSATSLFATMATDPKKLRAARGQFEAWQDRLITDDGIDPTIAALARVVGDGFWLIDLFGLAPPPDELRSAVIDRVIELVADASDPDQREAVDSRSNGE